MIAARCLWGCRRRRRRHRHREGRRPVAERRGFRNIPSSVAAGTGEGPQPEDGRSAERADNVSDSGFGADEPWAFPPRRPRSWSRRRQAVRRWGLRRRGSCLWKDHPACRQSRPARRPAGSSKAARRARRIVPASLCDLGNRSRGASYGCAAEDDRHVVVAGADPNRQL